MEIVRGSWFCTCGISVQRLNVRSIRDSLSSFDDDMSGMRRHMQLHTISVEYKHISLGLAACHEIQIDIQRLDIINKVNL